MNLKLVLAGLVGLSVAGGVFAAGNGNGNAVNGNASFNAVLKSNGVPSGQGGGLPASSLGDVSGRDFGGAVSDLAHNGGGGAVATVAGGNRAFVATVPEPDPYLMLLAGLGMVGLIARRRAIR